MSFLPIISAFFAGGILVGLFTWKVLLLFFTVLCLLSSVYVYLRERRYFFNFYVSGFWLFIFSEIMVFGSLLFCCLYFDTDYYINISSSLELPFLGCFVLLGSSLTVTSYHHLVY